MKYDREFVEKTAQALYEMFEMRTSRDWDEIAEHEYQELKREWRESAVELLERMEEFV